MGQPACGGGWFHPAAPDPVAGLVAKLEATHGLWLNGAFPKLDAPVDAPFEQVLAEVFEKMTLPEGKVTKYEMIEQREVTIPIVADRRLGPQEQYTAARVKTNVGEKVVLMQRSRTNWWSEFTPRRSSRTRRVLSTSVLGSSPSAALTSETRGECSWRTWPGTSPTRPPGR